MGAESNCGDSDEVKRVGFIIDGETKRMILMRAGQLGYSSMSSYFRALLENDLRQADLPPLKECGDEELKKLE